MDILLALCPWIILWKLTMTWREKLGVAIAMSMGVVYVISLFPSRSVPLTACSAGAASFTKLVKLPQLAGDPGESLPMRLRPYTDHSVDTVAVTIWGGAEGAITIMAASIPVLRTLILRNKTGVPHAELSPSDIRRLRECVSLGTTEGSQLSPSSMNREANSPLEWREKDSVI